MKITLQTLLFFIGMLIIKIIFSIFNLSINNFLSYGDIFLMSILFLLYKFIRMKVQNKKAQ